MRDSVRNITLSADEQLIEAARRRAAAQHTTLNAQFRLWLADYVGRDRQAAQAMRTVRALQGKLQVGRQLTRAERNER